MMKENVERGGISVKVLYTIGLSRPWQISDGKKFLQNIWITVADY